MKSLGVIKRKMLHMRNLDPWTWLLITNSDIQNSFVVLKVEFCELLRTTILCRGFISHLVYMFEQMLFSLVSITKLEVHLLLDG